uniref:Uncharacterized protein n=1 Tax=Proteus vulgaris TaxID=585 RepID=Q8KJW2_PROVU|nr:hypothetical protein [Proteus vulgaris]
MQLCSHPSTRHQRGFLLPSPPCFCGLRCENNCLLCYSTWCHRVLAF